MELSWHTLEDEGFAVAIPAGWEAERDIEEGGLDVWHPAGPGDLHLVGFPSASISPSDPAEELYAFLEEQQIELEEDEIESFELAGDGELAICQYVTEDEEESETAFWLVGVASIRGALVFAHYSCAAGEQDEEKESVLQVLRSVRQAGGGA